jgi:hypothetical protein
MDDTRWLKRGGRDAGKRDTNDTWKCMESVQSCGQVMLS